MNEKGCLLGLDLGEKRIGVAVSDELRLLAHPVGYILRRGNRQVFDELAKLIEEHGIQTIVVGLPKTLNNDVGTQAEAALAFVGRLSGRFTCKVVTWDERLTTAQAERALLAQDVSRAKRRQKRDAMAARIILQSYLDFLKEKDGINNV